LKVFGEPPSPYVFNVDGTESENGEMADFVVHGASEALSSKWRLADVA